MIGRSVAAKDKAMKKESQAGKVIYPDTGA